MLRYRRCWRYV